MNVRALLENLRLPGDGLSRRMLEIRPDIPILLYTGYNSRLD